ncbi:MAG: hypothetical protein M3325_07075, partial [Actinomycetota bacterium]|nr:hypothetical protein [Actinomycetota bacterium]
GVEGEEQELDQRLSGLWGQRETYHRWADDHPEVSGRLDHLEGEIETVDARLEHSRSAHGRAQVVETQGVVQDLSLGIDL